MSWVKEKVAALETAIREFEQLHRPPPDPKHPYTLHYRINQSICKTSKRDFIPVSGNMGTVGLGHCHYHGRRLHIHLRPVTQRHFRGR